MKKTEESVPTKVERTGEKTFKVKHSDGSEFEGNVETKEHFNALRNVKGHGTITSIGGIGTKKPLICDKCKTRVHKVTIKNSKSLCEKCD